MSRWDVALVTHEAGPDVDEDDVPLARALEAIGLTWIAAPWSRADMDWGSVRAAVVRSTWDYHLRRDEFLAWARAAGSATRLWNPANVIDCNTNKRYLLELGRAGVPIVPTAHVARGSSVSIAGLLAERGWTQAVVKPAVSIGSWRTIRVTSAPPAEDEEFFAALVAERDALIQPFVGSVETSGERCLVVIDGELTHAVRKEPRFGRTDRVPPSVRPVDPARDEEALARDVLAAAGATDLPYARVDLARDDSGRPCLMELELTEPRLYLRLAPPRAATRLARAIARRLG